MVVEKSVAKIILYSIQLSNCCVPWPLQDIIIVCGAQFQKTIWQVSSCYEQNIPYINDENVAVGKFLPAGRLISKDGSRGELLRFCSLLIKLPRKATNCRCLILLHYIFIASTLFTITLSNMHQFYCETEQCS